MSQDARQSLLGSYLLPVLCGNTRQARRLASRIARTLGTVSLICGEPSLHDLFDPSYHTLLLPKKPSDRLTLEALIDLGEAYPDRLLVLVPCSEKADRFVKNFRDRLESHYVLRAPDDFFSLPPVCDDTP